MRQKILRATGLIVILVLSVGASSALAAARAVVSEPIVDLGKVARGAKVEHAFELRNEGDARLTIREVKASCGCTVAKYDRSIAAGETGEISVVLTTDNFSGPIAKSVSVFTNDTENPNISLVLKANIQPQVEVRPGYARFIVIEGSGTESSTQTLWSTDGPQLEVRSVKSPYGFLKATSQRASADSGGPGRWEVRLSLDRSKAPIGPLADFVEVETNHPEQKVIRIPVSGFVRPEVSVTPGVAELGSHDLKVPYTATLEVRNQTDSAISLESVSTSVSGVEAAFEEVEAGKLYKVVLTLTSDMEKGPFSGKVEIVTSSRRRPVVEVALSGTVL